MLPTKATRNSKDLQHIGLLTGRRGSSRRASFSSRRVTLDASYVCTGQFEQDFTNLCKIRGDMTYIPPVIQRTPKMENAVATYSTKQIKAKKEKKEQRRVSACSEMMEVPKPDPEPEVGPYRTFKVKDSYQFFKPTVKVEVSSNPLESGSVTEVYVRGWQVDDRVMDVFRQCLPFLGCLRLLHLWNTGLTRATFATLHAFLPMCNQLTSLTLDANALDVTDVSLLLGEGSVLRDLSLRFCQLGDNNAEQIGRQLGTATRRNERLVNLNMSNNRIGDVGARGIAQGLKTNRTLLTLNVANNQIGDEGASALAETLTPTPFQPDNEQVCSTSQTKDLRGNKEPCVEKLTSRNATVLSSSAPPTQSSKARCKGTQKAKDDKDKEKEKERTPKRRRKASREPRATPHLRVTTPSTFDLKPSDRSPFNEADLCNGQSWMRGNRCLISLNLTGNKIGEAGLRCLLDMVQFQGVPCHYQRQTGIGLRRLLLDRNCVAAGNQVLRWIQASMAVRDPMNRTPVIHLQRTNISACAIPPLYG